MFQCAVRWIVYSICLKHFTCICSLVILIWALCKWLWWRLRVPKKVSGASCIVVYSMHSALVDALKNKNKTRRNNMYAQYKSMVSQNASINTKHKSETKKWHMLSTVLMPPKKWEYANGVPHFIEGSNNFTRKCVSIANKAQTKHHTNGHKLIYLSPPLRHSSTCSIHPWCNPQKQEQRVCCFSLLWKVRTFLYDSIGSKR